MSDALTDFAFPIGCVVALIMFVAALAFLGEMSNCGDGYVHVSGSVSGCVPWEVVYGNP